MAWRPWRRWESSGAGLCYTWCHLYSQTPSTRTPRCAPSRRRTPTSWITSTTASSRAVWWFLNSAQVSTKKHLCVIKPCSHVMSGFAPNVKDDFYANKWWYSHPHLVSDVGFPVEVGAQALLDAVVQFLTDLPPDLALRHVMVINKDEHVSSVIASAFEQVSVTHRIRLRTGQCHTSHPPSNRSVSHIASAFEQVSITHRICLQTGQCHTSHPPSNRSVSHIASTLKTGQCHTSHLHSNRSVSHIASGFKQVSVTHHIHLQTG